MRDKCGDNGFCECYDYEISGAMLGVVWKHKWGRRWDLTLILFSKNLFPSLMFLILDISMTFLNCSIGFGKLTEKDGR